MIYCYSAAFQRKCYCDSRYNGVNTNIRLTYILTMLLYSSNFAFLSYLRSDKARFLEESANIKIQYTVVTGQCEISAYPTNASAWRDTTIQHFCEDILIIFI